MSVFGYTRLGLWGYYHQEETHGVVEHIKFAVVRSLKLALNIKPARSQDDSKGNPETTVRRQSSSTKGVANSHFPVIALEASLVPEDGLDIPHASKQLNKTTITKSETNDDIRRSDVTSTHVDTSKHKGSQGESAQTKGRGITKLAVGHGPVQTRLEFTTKGRKTSLVGVDLSKRTVSKARSSASDLMLLVRHLRVGGAAIGGTASSVHVGSLLVKSRGVGGRVWCRCHCFCLVLLDNAIERSNNLKDKRWNEEFDKREEE